MQRDGSTIWDYACMNEDKLRQSVSLGKPLLVPEFSSLAQRSYSDSPSLLLLIKYDAFHSVIIVKNHCPLLGINNLSN